MTLKLLDKKKKVTTKGSLFLIMLEEEPLLNPEGYVKGLQMTESYDCFLLQLHTSTDLSNFLTSSTTH